MCGIREQVSLNENEYIAKRRRLSCKYVPPQGHVACGPVQIVAPSRSQAAEPQRSSSPVETPVKKKQKKPDNTKVLEVMLQAAPADLTEQEFMSRQEQMAESCRAVLDDIAGKEGGVLTEMNNFLEVISEAAKDSSSTSERRGCIQLWRIASARWMSS